MEQQTGMGCILHPLTIKTWLTAGDAESVLIRLQAQQVHPYIHFIDALQFKMDIIWVYGALLQSITGEATTALEHHRSS